MTSLIHWSPFNRSNVWPFDFWGDTSPAKSETVTPSKLGLDVIQNAENYTVEASLPGFTPEEIEVTVHDGLLRIVAEKTSDATREDSNYLIRERRVGKFYRAIRLPDGIDIDSAETGYKDGVLQITLPKSDSGRLKRLPIAA